MKSKMDTDEVDGNDPKEKKRNVPESTMPAGHNKMQKRAASSSDFEELTAVFPEKSSVIETKRVPIVEDETEAVYMTRGSNDPRPNRRLTDFMLADVDGTPQPIEMSDVEGVFISGTILPWDGSSAKDKDKSVRCEKFGWIESWAISGYEEGSPVIWVSTYVAHYACLKPARDYKKFYKHFFLKACSCVEVFQKLSKPSGGNPDLSLDELLAGVVHSMSGSKSFPSGMSIKDFVISQGKFIHNQLSSLDKPSQKISDLPVLVALRDESRKKRDVVPPYSPSGGSLVCLNAGASGAKIKDGAEKLEESVLSTGVGNEDEDAKLAVVLNQEEYWRSMLAKKWKRPANKFYIQINENEIANDYPLPAYYKTSEEETNEYIFFDNEVTVHDPDDLSKRMLHNWSLYNSDTRFISLELLPMKPCTEVDVTIYGSGIMTDDDDSDNVDGIPVYLSPIKEWMIKLGGASIFYISIRTEIACYRLGKPSKRYAPWYEPVIKTARLAISIITLLKEQSRVSQISFADVIKKVSEFEKDHPAYISSNPAVVERYVVVHGQIILQQFAEYPDDLIRKNCAFVTALSSKMEERQHAKLEEGKNAVVKQVINPNPVAEMGPVVSKSKPMVATTTRLINRIWGGYYSNHSPDDLKGDKNEPKEEEVDEEQEANEEDDAEEVDEENVPVPEMAPEVPSFRQTNPTSNSKQMKWDGEPVGTTCSGEPLYRQAILCGELIVVGCAVVLEVDNSEEELPIYFVEYMFETSDATKMVHGRVMQKGSQTVMGDVANEREVFLTNECMEFELGDVKHSVVLDVRLMSWGYQHRKDSINSEKIDRERAEERKRKGLTIEYYCKSLYWPDRGAFFKLPHDTMGLGTGVCCSCKIKEDQKEKEIFKINSSKSGFVYNGVVYIIRDYVYVAPNYFGNIRLDQGTSKAGRNAGLKAYVICQLLELDVPAVEADPKSTQVKVRRFFRPVDVSPEKAYSSDIREVYYSEQKLSLPVEAIQGKCEVRRKFDVPPPLNGLTVIEHIFFCEHLYEPDKGAIKQLPTSVRLASPKVDAATSRKRKGKFKEGEIESDILDKQEDVSQKSHLATLDIFAGCGGLSEGLQQSGVSDTKWAIEYEASSGEAFHRNHPAAFTFVSNCNVILRAIMEKCGDLDDCISTSEAAGFTELLDKDEKKTLPLPGQIDFIIGAPPCQRFKQSTWSKVQCEAILAFLSFADYFRPRFFLLEKFSNFLSFNKGQTFRLTLASLLELGYQVRFGILQAGAYGVAQSRKRAIIWAASPEETLPEWPEPMHVFAGPELKISLPGNVQYAAVRSTANGAPFRAITVRDTIGDLPYVATGASEMTMDYVSEPVSWFQRRIRGNMLVLYDHISKDLNQLNLLRCLRIPKYPGADWRDLPYVKFRLCNEDRVDLIPWFLPDSAKECKQWKGLFGRLDWEGNFPTSITEPQAMGKVGMCLHPEQDRIITVRECARFQGFDDSYQFAGDIQQKHRQIGNACPPPLAFVLGRALRDELNRKKI